MLGVSGLTLTAHILIRFIEDDAIFEFGWLRFEDDAIFKFGWLPLVCMFFLKMGFSWLTVMDNE